jgi:hypothetical protein
MLRYWKRKVAESFWKWQAAEQERFEARGEEPPRRSLEAGLAAIDHANDGRLVESSLSFSYF